MERCLGKIVLAVGVSLAVWIFFSQVAVTAEEEQEMPDEIVMDQEIYKTNRKGPVTFSHGDHAESYDIACNACHHVYKDGKNVWEEGAPVQKCAACHDPNMSEGRVKKLSIAYHKNCKGCHRKLAAEGGYEAPYKQCTDCHEKKS
jgi:hypothetical protein